MSAAATPLLRLWGERASAPALSKSLRAPDSALAVPPATDRTAWDSDVGRLHAPTVRQLVQQAEGERDEPWPQPHASLFADYIRTGDRTRYEAQIFARQTRLTGAVVAAATTADPRWLDEVVDGLVLLCEQSSWCWPAHDDAFARQGWLVPDRQEPVLDLGAGEVAAQIAWADHVLGAHLDEHVPGLRTLLRREVRSRILDPYLNRRDWWWIGEHRQVNNWNPWICGNVLTAALTLLDSEQDADLRARIVAQTIADVDNYVAALPEDGAVDEGAAYWWQGACRLLEMLDLLDHATDGTLDATGLKSVREAVAFPQRMHLGRGWYLNVADSSARIAGGHPWDVPHRWAIRVGNDDARCHAAAQDHADWLQSHSRAAIGRSLGRVLRALTDQDWAAVVDAPPVRPSGNAWLPSVQVFLAHSSRTDAPFSLAVKGGHNGENHNHNDVGTVVVAWDGIPVIVDPGRPTYTRQTFGPDRYDLWPMQSQWHSVPLIRGSAQRAGEPFAARNVALIREGASVVGLELDLAGAYECEDIRSWRRRAILEEDGVRVTDTWDLDTGSAGPKPCRAHWILAGTVELIGQGHAQVQPLYSTARVSLTWDQKLSASVQTKELDDPLLTEVWGRHLTRLVIDLDVDEATGQGSTTLRVHTS